MGNHIISDRFTKSSSLNAAEKQEIEHKVEFEVVKSHYNMIKLGAVANVLSGIFVIWILYGEVSLSLLIGWYIALVLANVANIVWANYYSGSIAKPDLLKMWRKGFFFLLAAICLIWGSIGILFVSHDAHYELYIITFLQVVVLGFSFSSVTDFIIAVLSISCLLIPTIFYRLYLTIYSRMTIGYDPNLNLAFGISLFILGAFLVAACYFGDRLIKKFFKVSFENTLLNQKLENMNKFLEQRVQERTLELENSLKLVQHQATHDLLTDLPNQRSLLKYIESAIKTNHSFAVIFFSLNEMEKISNGLGHQAGDFVIKAVAQRLQNIFEKLSRLHFNFVHYSLTLSRKDVFVILLEPVTKFGELEENAEYLFSCIDDPVRIDDQQGIKLTASIGISTYPRDGRDIKSLLMNADAAMLRAKQQGGNSLNIYDAKINADLSKQIEIESYLHTAVKKGEFLLQYQPFVDLKTGVICGAEALVRWKHPLLGLISPTIFIPLAEANGVIIALGEWVLRTACVEAKHWHDLGFNSLKISVNFSAKQLRKKNITQTITQILKETNIRPEYLELELTESEAFKNEVIPILKQFKAMSLSLSIDDFGTGYSGLTNLKLFAIDKLKIDKSFIKDIATNADSRAIVANTIDLAKNINVQTVAEGVETKEQLKFLQEHGCDMIQGFYFSEPMYPIAFSEFLMSDKKLIVE